MYQLLDKNWCIFVSTNGHVCPVIDTPVIDTSGNWYRLFWYQFVDYLYTVNTLKHQFQIKTLILVSCKFWQSTTKGDVLTVYTICWLLHIALYKFKCFLFECWFYVRPSDLCSLFKVRHFMGSLIMTSIKCSKKRFLDSHGNQTWALLDRSHLL